MYNKNKFIVRRRDNDFLQLTFTGKFFSNTQLRKN